MKEISEILAGFNLLCAEGKSAALATVVAVSGSAYRRPGARMLIAGDGRTWGGVSGGCLERDVARRAQAIIGDQITLNCRYDTTDDEELSTGVATGCRGTVDIFMEPLCAASPGPMPWLAQVMQSRTGVTLATVIKAEKAAAFSAGLRFELGRSGLTRSAPQTVPPNVRGLVRNVNLATAEEASSSQTGTSDPVALRAAIDVNMEPGIFDSRWPIIATELDGKPIAVFVERIEPATSLVIFGGGADVVPVVTIAKALGWHVTVVAGRPALRIRERFALADAVHVTSSDDPLQGVELRPEDAVALMTHNYPRDLKILSLLAFQPRYLGILGPRSRTAELLADQRPGGIALADVHAPIGLNIGAQTPEAIALAIVAEIEAVLRGGGGGSLRDCSGPIHAKGSEKIDPGSVGNVYGDSRQGPACPI